MISSKNESIKFLQQLIAEIESGAYCVRNIQKEDEFLKLMRTGGGATDVESVVEVKMKFRRIS